VLNRVYGLLMSQGSVINCRALSFSVACTLCLESSMYNPSAENCTFAVQTGVRNEQQTGPIDIQAFSWNGSIQGGEFERCMAVAYLSRSDSSMIFGNKVHLDVPPSSIADATNISTVTWSGASPGTVTVNTSSAHNITPLTNLVRGGSVTYPFNRQLRLRLDGTIHSFLPGNQSNGTTLDFVTVSVTSGTQFTFSVPGTFTNPGTYVGGSGTWGYKPLACISCDSIGNTVIGPNSGSTSGELLLYDFSNFLTSGGATLTRILVLGDTDGGSITVPSPGGGISASNAALFFDNSCTQPSPWINFADLPGQSPGSNQSPFASVGMEYVIRDGQTFTGGTPDGSPVLGNVARGGSSSKIKVWFNGTDWFCIAK
jgi:hypothetical protein